MLEEIEKRRSCRKFKRKKVSAEVIEKLVWAACQAPAGGNLARWEVIVVTNEEVKNKLTKASLNQEFISEASVVLVFIGGREFNTACAVENLLVVAHTMGLEGCIVGAFDREAVRKILNIPDDVNVNCIVPVGYPKVEEKNPGKRYPVEVIHFERYGARKITEETLKTVVKDALLKVEEFNELLKELVERFGENSFEVYRLEEKYAAFVFKPILWRIRYLLTYLGFKTEADKVSKILEEYSNGRGKRLSETRDINSKEVIEWERKYSREIFPKIIKELGEKF